MLVPVELLTEQVVRKSLVVGLQLLPPVEALVTLT